MIPKMQNTLRRTIGVALMVALSAGGVLVWAFTNPMPPSLYKPEHKREMTQEQRWKLDFDLANETTIYANSRRFDAPGSFEKRARWVEQEAVTYQIADLVQQIMDIRVGRVRNNQGAFNQLVELGQQGDAGASCLANLLYQYHQREDTIHWKHNRDDVTRLALKAKAASGHPVCAGLESRLYMRGEMGYPKDPEKVKHFIMEGAVAGFWGDQLHLADSHLTKGQVIDPKEAERRLCWSVIADRFSPASRYFELCDMYSRGPAFNQDLKPIEVPDQIKELAQKWCKPSPDQLKISAQDCANLENK